MTMLFRNWTVKPDSPYDKCHGLYQADNGDLVFVGRIRASDIADTVFEQMSKLPVPTLEEYSALVSAFKEMGIEVSVGQRFRRKNKKDTDSEKPCLPPISESPSSPDACSTASEPNKT